MGREGGAMVKADTGVCLIDEFDKMNDQDRVSIHEAMEQQTISISKAGIICKLKARCSVIAAANPITGRYNSSATFAENVELTDAILSRFDLLCVVRDIVDQDIDTKLATFVVNSHVNALNYEQQQLNQHNNNIHQDDIENNDIILEEDDIDDDNNKSIDIFRRRIHHLGKDLLKKYIMYAKENCKPQLANIDEAKMASLYSELRQESNANDGIPIAVRHMESILRMSEAHAKMHLRDYVNEEDVNAAIKVMIETFISTQKFGLQNNLRKTFGKYIRGQKDHYQILLHTLQGMVADERRYRNKQRYMHTVNGTNTNYDIDDPITIKHEDFADQLLTMEITSFNGFYSSDLFRKAGYVYNYADRLITKV